MIEKFPAQSTEVCGMTLRVPHLLPCMGCRNCIEHSHAIDILAISRPLDWLSVLLVSLHHAITCMVICSSSVSVCQDSHEPR